MRRILLLLLILGAIGGGGAYWLRRDRAPAVTFRTQPVKRGELIVSISATGTVEPEEVIDVGAQVLGKIKRFGTDATSKPVDYGTAVEEGMVLAHIDEALYAADVQQSMAQLESAKATVRRDQADLGQLKAKLVQAERNWKRAQELGPSRALSATDFDSYKAVYETALATVAVGDAAIVQSQKACAQAEASLKRAKTNLDYCTIRSPVNGVIIDRRVNIGQTVVASLNAPSLFLIAKDLRRMQVWVAVNEADIGKIHPGQSVRFTVDAHPGQNFTGVVGKIRLNASMIQNVVNYTVEVNTDNSSGKLLPYLTANVQFEVDRREEALIVPNAALRFKPSSPQLVVEDQRQEFAEENTEHPDGPRGRARGPATSRPTAGGEAVVWVRDGHLLRPVRGRLGLNDGNATEFDSDALTDSAEVVVAEVAAASTSTARTPFAAPVFGRR